MTTGEQSNLTLHAECSICHAPIRWGETVISILRNVERLDTADKMIHTEDSVVLASLCSTCGRQLPAEAIRVTFVAQDNR
jgi:hypothetical protein